MSKIDWFAGLDQGYCNGPRCIACGEEGFCIHCHGEKLNERKCVPHYVCSMCGGVTFEFKDKCPGCGVEKTFYVKGNAIDKGLLAKDGLGWME